MTEREQYFLQGLKESNREVFEKLFREYYPLLCNYARRYIYDKSTAEDIVQEFFCKLWDKRFEIKVSTSLNNYFYKSVTNLCFNHFRDTEAERKLIDFRGDEIPETASGSRYQSDNELNEHLGRALLELPEKRREIFELSRFEGLKYHEIAEKLDLSIKTVETQMTRSLEFLRKYLKEFISVMALIINVINKS